MQDHGPVSAAEPTRDIVVLVHGVWMSGLDMSLLKHRLVACGFEVRIFTYPTIRSTLKENALRLQHFLQRLDAGRIHFVAHSLGGLLVRQLFHDFPQQKPGRVVTLGTPHGGSSVARRMGGSPYGKWLLGKSFKQGLRGDVPPWTGARKLLVIAGTVSMGVGRLVARLARPNDGTVAVKETRLDSADAHLELPVTHMGMLFSTQVARAVCDYLHAVE